jgi:nucleoside-diphosphate-sugar epimerase
MQKVMVTGGAGFIGSHLVDALCEAGHQVVVLDDLSTGHKSNLAKVQNRIEFVKGDIRDIKLLAKHIRGCDLVFHQAAEVSVTKTVADPLASAMVNEIGTLNLLESARKANVKRVVLASSCAVYGNNPELPKQEKMAPAPLSPYAVQKLTGEYYARMYQELYGLETASLRYFNVYGPRQDPSSPYSGVISIFLTKALNGDSPTIYGDGDQYRDFVYVADVVAANLRAAACTEATGACYNIGTGQTVSVKDLWAQIANVTNCDKNPRFESARQGDVRASAADITLAVQKLGYTPKFGFRDGLKLTCDWYGGDRISHKIS